MRWREFNIEKHETLRLKTNHRKWNGRLNRMRAYARDKRGIFDHARWLYPATSV
jgi:hypothetical protein